ncbi:hypothetical protein FSP39_004311 [Pinctada imbricata]|uniref:Nuclear receptor-binding factor 2 MIT domain-containing protein n=1 Tax=Pinctada imbricata TaxID=66713 RepID=A0AA88XYX2_PINIB|nr:hypothetical protein FSP39_004311 [Pinctada imbricata]
MVKSKKLEEAMLCHRRAAEYLLQALDNTNSHYAQESIHTQHQYHIRQQDLLQKRLIKAENLAIKLLNKKENVQNQATQTEEFGLHFAANHFQAQEGPSVHIPQMIPEEDRVYHAMSETDSILGYLVHRSRYMPSSEVEIGSDSTVSFRNQHSKLKRGTMSKFPRDDSAVIEELTVQNSELRKQVSDLIKQLDDVRKDKKYLEDKVFKMTESQVLDDETGGLGSPDMDLPPLEMPQFDFDSLQSTKDSVHYDQKGMIFNCD